jgi:hypothetical protein
MAIWTTRHIKPDQARFEPKYFLALTEDGPPLFNRIGQCFQDISLTKKNKLSESDASTIMTLQKQVSKSEPGTTRGSHQVVQSRRLTDPLALHCKEAAFMLIHEFMQRWS